VDKFEPVPSGGDMNRVAEVFGELVIACCYGGVDFQATEEAFDVDPLPVGHPVMFGLDPAI
jgi:hypothetical protein